jgi:N-acetyl-gamma-glutamyl-phosphate reductase
MKNINAVIIGASGYTGAELLRLLITHPQVNVVGLVAESNAGKEIAEIYPQFSALTLPKIVKLDEIDFTNVEVAFCCLPHATSQKIIKTLPDHLKVIDLSADFRIQDIELYEKWYGPHYAKELQPEAVYGLTEIYREKIKGARIIACPGCYPTSVLLPLLPLIASGAIDESDIIVDSKSGVTGAGRSTKQNLLYCEVNDGIGAYAVKGHRHTAEISENLGANITFVPHLTPMNRGISSSIFIKLKTDYATARAIIAKQYQNETFVKLLDGEIVPTTHMVRGTNNCFMNIFEGQKPGNATIISVIDNLSKGASGQAVQNMNLVFGLPENTGLGHTAVFP